VLEIGDIDILNQEGVKQYNYIMIILIKNLKI
jgi:hypothetical protein